LVVILLLFPHIRTFYQCCLYTSLTCITGCAPKWVLNLSTSITIMHKFVCAIISV
jgi:hypothetical protein